MIYDPLFPSRRDRPVYSPTPHVAQGHRTAGPDNSARASRECTLLPCTQTRATQTSKLTFRPLAVVILSTCNDPELWRKRIAFVPRYAMQQP